MFLSIKKYYEQKYRTTKLDFVLKINPPQVFDDATDE